MAKKTVGKKSDSVLRKHVQIEMPEIEAINALHIKCHSCGDTTKIPMARFYDGFEGVFSCNSCEEPLDHLMDSLDE